VIEFSAQGYLEVWRGPDLVSRHRVEREAIESVLRDAEATGGTAYEIRPPVIRVTVSSKAVGSIELAGELP
jgi:hypothetical protein